ncbi:MAG: efflux RND transporter periplasmic adaptor subunit [Alphaproteobacteria bacterium]|nr:efflux RND transporter periplasmic adaptor subunit [Alphaproteobacteria bacterium]
MLALLWMWTLTACGDAPAPDAAGGGPPPALVEVAQVTDGALTDAWTTQGEVRALDAAEMAFGAGGPVARVFVREGDAVKAGDTLAELDLSLAAARLRAARASHAAAAHQLQQARTTLTRSEKVREGVLAPNELDALRAEVARLEAQAESLDAGADLAAAELGRHKVRAPFDGVVTARYVDPGDWVNAGAPALDLVSTEAVEIRVAVAQSLVQRLVPGDGVTLLSEPEVAGRVVAVVPALDPEARTALVRVAPAAGDWMPGASVPVRFSVTWGDDGVLLPRDALVLGPGTSRVVKVVDGAAESFEVQVLATASSGALVSSDKLAPGDTVVTRGNERVRPGQPIQLRETP